LGQKTRGGVIILFHGRLLKPLHRLKQAAADWYRATNAALLSLGFRPQADQPCLYRLPGPPQKIFVMVHVDNLFFVAAPSDEDYAWFEDAFGRAFEIERRPQSIISRLQ
jgi:hypothetical protein